MSARDKMQYLGRPGYLARVSLFNRQEKDELRADPDVELHGGCFYIATGDAEALADIRKMQEEQELDQDSTTARVDDSDEPTMDDLRSLKVAELQALADKEEVDLTGLKLKDDILGRLAAHFGLDPAS